MSWRHFQSILLLLLDVAVFLGEYLQLASKNMFTGTGICEIILLRVQCENRVTTEHHVLPLIIFETRKLSLYSLRVTFRPSYRFSEHLHVPRSDKGAVLSFQLEMPF